MNPEMTARAEWRLVRDALRKAYGLLLKTPNRPRGDMSWIQEAIELAAERSKLPAGQPCRITIANDGTFMTHGISTKWKVKKVAWDDWILFSQDGNPVAFGSRQSKIRDQLNCIPDEELLS